MLEPKRCILSIGGWADWTAIGNKDNAIHIAKLIRKLVRLTYADGIDLNFDHLGELTRHQNHINEVLNEEAQHQSEYELFAFLATTLRSELDAISVDGMRAGFASEDLTWLNSVCNATHPSRYCVENKEYLETIILEHSAKVYTYYLLHI